MAKISDFITEIAEMKMDGLSDQQIAASLGVSESLIQDLSDVVDETVQALEES